MIDPKKIEEWKALTEAATPGPWSADDRDPKTGYLCGAIVVQVPAVGARVEGRGVIANVRHDGPRHRPDANAAFIAAAREALPALLAERDEILGHYQARKELCRKTEEDLLVAQRERDAALSLLREVEWSGTENGQDACPDCCGYRNPPPGDLAVHGARLGHAPGCRLAALLGRTP